MTPMASLFCNVLWLLSCLPDTLAFLWATAFPRAAQCRALRRILRHNAATDLGRRYGFCVIRRAAAFDAAVPVSDYADYSAEIERLRASGRHGAFVAEPVRVLEPTSGTGSAPKMIPYTRTLQREFAAAVHPWLTGLFVGCPALLCGRQYWSLSPNTPALRDRKGDRVRVGFETDADYLGSFGRRLARHVLAVPPELARVTDPEAFEYLTLLYLVRDAHLRLISVWHPSFLTLLLDALPRHWWRLLEDMRAGAMRDDLDVPEDVRALLRRSLPPAPRRADALTGLSPADPAAPRCIWPRLRVISCWTRDSNAVVSRLRAVFPGVWIQEKGLVATEGIVTLPCGRQTRQVAAVRSHYLEFLDRKTGLVNTLWNLAPEREYVVLLTTGGGFYRYCLHDRVKLDGRFLRTPCLRFLGREGCVSDLVGEKIDLRLVEEALDATRAELEDDLGFAMLAPYRGAEGERGYVCYAQGRNGSGIPAGLATALDAALCRNYHYRHARRLGQLDAVRVFALSGSPAAEYRRHMGERGMKWGDNKFPRLSCDDGWHEVFKGHFVPALEDAPS